MPMPAVTIGEIVDFVGGKYAETGHRSVTAVAALAQASPGQLSFLSNRKYAAQLGETKAGAILVPQDLEGQDERWIRVADPYFAIARIMTRWFGARPMPSGVSAEGFHRLKRQAGDERGGGRVYHDWRECCHR